MKQLYIFSTEDTIQKYSYRYYSYLLGVYKETKTKHDNVPVYKQVHSLKDDTDRVGRENGHWWIYWSLTVSIMAQHGWHPQYRSRDGGDEPPEQGWQVFTGPPKSIHGDSKYKLS